MAKPREDQRKQPEGEITWIERMVQVQVQEPERNRQQPPSISGNRSAGIINLVKFLASPRFSCSAYYLSALFFRQ